MLNSLFKSKKTLIIIGGILIGFTAWYVLAGSGGSSSTSLVTTTRVGTGQETGTSPQEQSILDTLFKLRTIQLNGTIFSDPLFTSLKDFRTDIVAEPIGRRNPFAPLGQNAGPSPTASASVSTPAAPASGTSK